MSFFLKAAEREATTQSMSTVDYSSKNISEGNTNITMTESTATTEAMNVSTIENATEGMTSATVVTATTVVTTTEATTGTVTENITEVASTGITETISLGASNSSSTNPSETTAPSTSVNTSSGVTEKVSSLSSKPLSSVGDKMLSESTTMATTVESSNQTIVVEKTQTTVSANDQYSTSKIVSASQEMMNTTQPTTKDSTATLSTLKESDENNSTMEESNTVTSPSISENQSSSVKPLETSNGMKSTRVTTTSTETEATEVLTTISPTNYTQLMHTGAIGITSQFKLQCKNHTVDSLKGMLLLPCTVETSVDIQFNKTSLKWKTADGTNRMVISGEKKYGVMLNITAKQENSTEYTGYINFDQDSEFGKKIELTLSVFLINGENKEDKFDVQFIGKLQFIFYYYSYFQENRHFIHITTLSLINDDTCIFNPTYIYNEFLNTHICIHSIIKYI